MLVGLLAVALLCASASAVSAEVNAPGEPVMGMQVNVTVGATGPYGTQTNSGGLWASFGGLPSPQAITVNAGPYVGVPGTTVSLAGAVGINGQWGTLPYKTAQLWIDQNKNGVYGDGGDTLYDEVTTDVIGDYVFAAYSFPPQPVHLGVKILVGSQPHAGSVHGQIWVQ
jgi:hypothetical protein